MMDELSAQVLQEALDQGGEPMAVIRTDQSGWPVMFRNRAFTELVDGAGVPDGFEQLADAVFDRDAVVQLSEALRSRDEARFAVTIDKQQCLLVLKPLSYHSGYCAVWIYPGGDGAQTLIHQALVDSRHKPADQGRKDPVTGLPNERVFLDVLRHDWAVSRREGSSLGVLAFRIEDYEAYTATFGRSTAEAGLNKVAKTIRRCLRRASEVVARFGDDGFLVLSHAAEADATAEFAERIATGVRDLGLHHPKSSVARFVTVSSHVRVVNPKADDVEPDALVAELVR